MQHVRLTIDAGGREAEIHPMYDVLANAPFVERATAVQWNFSGDELGILHYVEGDVGRYREAAESIPEVRSFAVAPAGEDAFYAYVRDETTEPLRRLFGAVTRSPVVVVPPMVYHSDGSVSYSVFGPSADIQSAVDALPEPISVSVEEVSGLAGTPGVAETLLTERQREAVEAALEVGYYDIPRTGSQADVAGAIGCAPSTAAEHLRKAESKVLSATFGRG